MAMGWKLRAAGIASLNAHPARGGFLAIIRFRWWAHFLLLPLAALALDRPSAPHPFSIFRGECVAFFVLAFGYLANGVADRTMDRDPNKNPLVVGCGESDPDNGHSFQLPLVVLASVAFGFALTGPLIVVSATLCSLLSGWAYSLGPRLKARPVVGTLMNVTSFAPLLLVAVDRPPARDRVATLVAAFAVLLVQNQLLHEGADAAEDRDGGLRTTFVALGGSGAALLAVACGAVLLWAVVRAIGANTAPWWVAFGTAPFILVFPPLLALWERSPARLARARSAHRWSAVACGALLFALDVL